MKKKRQSRRERWWWKPPSPPLAWTMAWMPPAASCGCSWSRWNLSSNIEEEMASALRETGISDCLLSIKGGGIVPLSVCLGDLDNPQRFDDPQQMSQLAGYNLVEDSSVKNICISKRDRKGLRRVLYQMALTVISKKLLALTDVLVKKSGFTLLGRYSAKSAKPSLRRSSAAPYLW